MVLSYLLVNGMILKRLFQNSTKRYLWIRNNVFHTRSNSSHCDLSRHRYGSGCKEIYVRSHRYPCLRSCLYKGNYSSRSDNKASESLTCRTCAINSKYISLRDPVISFFVFDTVWKRRGGLTEIVLAWIGISIGVHALPAYATVRWYLDKLPEQSRRGATYYFLWLMAPIMSIVGVLKWIWFDLFYAILVGLMGPLFVTWLYTLT